MLKMLKEIFNSITGFFELVFSLVDFVIGFIEDLVYVVKLVGQFVLKIPSYFAWLPSQAVTMVVTVFGIVVVYKILGREG